MTTIVVGEDPPGQDSRRSGAPALPDRAPVAWRPVLLIAGLMALVLGLTSTRYGWFGDEMYFLSAGARPAAGYADQPPMLPLLAAAADALAPGSLFVLRLPAIALTAAQVVLEIGRAHV